MTSKVDDWRWFKLLPALLRGRLQERQLLQRVLGNTGWLVSEKLLRMGGGLFITVWIARYLGPAEFGLFNYALAYVALFAAVATLGLQGIVVRDLVHRPEAQREILASALLLRLTGAGFAIALSSASILWVRPGDRTAWLLVTILAFGFLPQTMDVIDFHYQSRIRCKPIVLVRNITFFFFSLVKIGLLLSHGTLLAFATALSAEALCVAIAMMWLARREDIVLRLCDATASECLRLLKESWPLIIAGLSIMIYMRIDQVMLGHLASEEAVGVYSAATRISEVWYFIPGAIMASMTPVLAASYQRSEQIYQEQLLKVMRYLTWLSIFVAMTLSLVASPLIDLLYGVKYELASKVLMIHTWAGVFVCLGVGANPWFMNARLLRYSMEQTLVGAVANVALNIALIPPYGAIGAAIATLVSYAISALLFNGLRVKTWPIFLIQLRAFYR